MCSFVDGSGDNRELRRPQSFIVHQPDPLESLLEIDSVVRSALNFIGKSKGDIALQIAVNISEVAIRAAIQ